MDRTEELLAIARALQARGGASTAAQLEETARRLLPSPLPRSHYQRCASAVAASLRQLRALAALRRAEARDPLRAGGAEQEAADAEVSAALRDVRERIDALARLAPAAAAAAAPAQAAGELQAHYTGVALLLSERLADVAQRFDRERALRTRLALAAAAARRSRAPAPAREAAPRARATQAGEGGGGGGGGAQVHSQQALAESRALAEELHRFVDDVRAAEGSMVQVAALSQTFSAHVAAQAEQIEALYSTALEASRNFARGNVELEKTLERSGGARRAVAAILLLASFLLLLLDWLSG